jgi:hypothetical protein
VTLRARWVTLRARWVMLRARWVTLRARWVTLRARWVVLQRAYGGPGRDDSSSADPPGGPDDDPAVWRYATTSPRAQHASTPRHISRDLCVCVCVEARRPPSRGPLPPPSRPRASPSAARQVRQASPSEPLSITQRARSATQRARSATQRRIRVSELFASPRKVKHHRSACSRVLHSCRDIRIPPGRLTCPSAGAGARHPSVGAAAVHRRGRGPAHHHAVQPRAEPVQREVRVCRHRVSLPATSGTRGRRGA